MQTDQQVKYFLHMHDNVSLIIEIPVKKMSTMVAYICNDSAGEVVSGGSLELAGQPVEPQ